MPPQSVLYNLQHQDPELSVLIDYLQHDILPTDNVKARRLIVTSDDYYLNENGILCHLWSPGSRRINSLCSQIVAPQSIHHESLTACCNDPTLILRQHMLVVLHIRKNQSSFLLAWNV